MKRFLSFVICIFSVLIFASCDYGKNSLLKESSYRYLDFYNYEYLYNTKMVENFETDLISTTLSIEEQSENISLMSTFTKYQVLEIACLSTLELNASGESELYFNVGDVFVSCFKQDLLANYLCEIKDEEKNVIFSKNMSVSRSAANASYNVNWQEITDETTMAVSANILYTAKESKLDIKIMSGNANYASSFIALADQTSYFVATVKNAANLCVLEINNQIFTQTMKLGTASVANAIIDLENVDEIAKVDLNDKSGYVFEYDSEATNSWEKFVATYYGDQSVEK